MVQIKLKPEDELKLDHPARRGGYILEFRDKDELGIKLLQPKRHSRAEVYLPDGSLLAVLLKGVIPEQLQNEAFDLLKTVKGNPDNRPGIIGENARQQRVRKSDGKLSPRTGVSSVVMKKYKGKADMLGYYRYRHPPKCKVTSWTRSKPELYKAILPFILKVDEIYKSELPERHAKQIEYANKIPQKWRIAHTAFTTLYVLKNAPTATHTDTFDIEQGYGVMASLGSFRGGWLCFPNWRLAIDYQPGDLLLADVHRLHANFPIFEDDMRVACVFFCRADQDLCPG